MTQQSTPIPNNTATGRPGLGHRLQAKVWGEIAPRLLGANRRDVPLPDPMVLPARLPGRAWGTSHYNVVIPDLPEPHRFLATTIINGSPGFRLYDNDFTVVDSPRRTATLSHGTAATTHESFTTYSIPRDCEFRADGTLRWGDDLEISGTYPHYRVRSSRPGFALDLTLTAAGAHSNYARSFLYTHFGLLTRYTGTIDHLGETTPVDGLCSFEYACGRTLHVLRDRVLPRALKLPVDFFTWQVINLDDTTQLQIAQMAAQGHEILSRAWLSIAGKGVAHSFDDVRLDVVDYQDRPCVTPDGREKFLPRTIRLAVPLDAGDRIEFTGMLDTQAHYGLGRGYTGGYHYEGTRSGAPISGRGYIEWADVRDE